MLLSNEGLWEIENNPEILKPAATDNCQEQVNEDGVSSKWTEVLKRQCKVELVRLNLCEGTQK